jgi:hypothetical protein
MAQRTKVYAGRQRRQQWLTKTRSDDLKAKGADLKAQGSQLKAQGVQQANDLKAKGSDLKAQGMRQANDLKAKAAELKAQGINEANRLQDEAAALVTRENVETTLLGPEYSTRRTLTVYALAFVTATLVVRPLVIFEQPTPEMLSSSA